MHQFFVIPSQICQNNIIITGDDVNHIKNVLRLKIDEEIAVSNGVDGKEYRCRIKEMNEQNIACELLFIREEEVELPSKVYLFQAIPKGDKMEWIIQKTVELGVYQIIPIETKRGIVKLDGKKARSKVARWQSIAEAAAKQSKRRIIPEVKEIMSFQEALLYISDMDVKLIPYEMAKDMGHTKQIIDGLVSGQSIGVFIGSEGGFDENEIEGAIGKGVLPITMGKRILRTETAGMTILGWIMYQLEL